MTGTGSAIVILRATPITRNQYDSLNNFINNTMIPNLSGSGIKTTSEPQYTEN